MNDKRLNKEKVWTSKATSTVFLGLLLRAAMLFVVVYAAKEAFDWDIFYIEDDKGLDEYAGRYLYNAKGILDIELLSILGRGWASPFWLYVSCITSKLLNTTLAPRILNVIFSTLCVAVIYNLCYELSNNQKTALTAARLFAFLPLPILVCCFPIKDIFITYGVIYAFYVFVRVQNDRKISMGQILLCASLLVCVYFARGGVTESLLMILLVYYLKKLYRGKRYVAALLLAVSASVVFVVFRSTIFSAFEEKLDVYGNYGVDEAAGLNAIRVTSMADIYKLPLAYAFAMLQPMKLELFTIAADTRPWRTAMTYANITMYPVAVGAWLYMFVKKHNLFFWLSGFVMFSAVIMMSLGVHRHYLFLLPLHMINCSLYMEDTHANFKNRRTLLILGTFALLVLVFCYSLVKLL